MGLLTLLSITSCKKETNGFVEYKIKKGNHRSKNSIKLTKKPCLFGHVKFTESCRYHLGRIRLDDGRFIDNQLDWNKLFGFSCAGQNHNKNSIRLGWRYNVDLDKIDLCLYIKQAGETIIKEFSKKCEIYEELLITINKIGSSWVVIVGTEVVHFDFLMPFKGLHYHCYPYFGGDDVAPHDIDVLFRRVYT